MKGWTASRSRQRNGVSLQGLAVRLLLMVCLAVLATTGCTVLGPRLLQGERVNYNLALQYTTDEQMLLNLVRLKYRDPPMFLDVSGIATQFAVSASAQAGADLQANANDLFSLGLGLTYST